MAGDREPLWNWHRLFGLLLTDFFTGAPFIVELERDLSLQRQFLDVVIVRRGRGRFPGRLPDGLDDLAVHNLITFKSHREALDDWAIKELIGHYVAYRKLVSSSPSVLLSEDYFRLYAVTARFPHNLSGQVPWRERQAGVYDCRWGTDEVRVIVAGQLPCEAHNAPLHLFSASPDLISYGQNVYQPRSVDTSELLGQLFMRYQGEGFTMSYTMHDFRRDYIKEYLPKLAPQERREILQSLPLRQRRELLQSLPPQDRREVLESLPVEERLAGMSAEQIRQYLEQMESDRSAKPRKPRRKR